MAETVTLSGDYGFQATRLNPADSTTIDANDARWIVANIGSETNPYPVIVDGGADVTITGGTISGRVPLDMDWRDAYANSAALFLRNPEDVVVRDWWITRAWDGIRIRGDENSNFTIDNVYLSEIRDDAIENDAGVSGTISNSFFDGVFVGLSTGEAGLPDRTDGVVTLDNVLMRMESYLYRGEVSHQSPFKVFDNSPQMHIHDTVIAIEDVNHLGQARLPTAWAKTVEASNNYYLNLSDEPFPDDYPLPGEGFTILQGQEARDHWAQASAAWGTDAFDADDDDGADTDADADGGSQDGSGSDGAGASSGNETGQDSDRIQESSGDDNQESRSETASDDDDGPGGIFGAILSIFRSIFGGGRSSGGDNETAAAAEALNPSRPPITDEDLSQIMLPPGDEAPPADDDEQWDDDYAII